MTRANPKDKAEWNEDCLKHAERLERQANEMKLIGDRAAEHSFRQMAQTYLDEME